MDITTLKNIITSSISGQTFSFALTAITDPELDTVYVEHLFQTHFPYSKTLILLNPSKPKTQGQRVIVTGTGVDDIFNQLSVSASFGIETIEDKQELVLDISTTVKDNWKLQDGFPALSSTYIAQHLYFNGVSFKSSSHPKDPSDVNYGLFFQGTPLLNSPFDVLQFLLGGFANKPITGEVNMSLLGPAFQMSADLPIEVDLGFLKLKDVEYFIDADSLFNIADNLPQSDASIGLSANIFFQTKEKDHKIPIFTYISDPQSRILFEAQPNEGFHALLDELQTFADGHDLSIPSEVFSIGDKINLKDIKISIDPSASGNKIQDFSLAIDTVEGLEWELLTINQRTIFTLKGISLVFRINYSPAGSSISGLIVGKVGIGHSGVVELAASFEKSQGNTHFAFSAVLSEGPLKIGEVFNHFLESTPLELPDLEVQEFYFDFTTGSPNYKGSFVLDANNWSVFKDKLSIREMVFHLAHNESSGYTIDATGFFDVFGHSMSIAGTYTQAESWTFSGGTTDDKNISLTALMNELLGIFDVHLPDVVPDINLKNIFVSFNTKSKNFSFRGETLVEIEVPFIHNDHTAKKLHASADLKYLLDAQTNQHRFEGMMEADLLIGGATFKLQFVLGKQTQEFQATWEATESETLNFLAIPEALGISNFGKESPSNPISLPEDFDLGLTKVAFVYQADKDTFLLSATSKKYGTAFFVASGVTQGVGDAGAGASPVEGGDSSRWHYVFGFEFAEQGKLDQLPPSFGNIRSIDFIEFREIGISIASADFTAFTIPQLPSLSGPPVGNPNAPALPGAKKSIRPNTTLRLHKGVSAYAVLDFSLGQTDARVNILKGITGGGELIISGGYDLTQQAFYVAALLEGGVGLNSGSGSDLAIRNPSLEINIGDEITFKVFGDMAVTLNHQTIDVRPGIEINESEMEGTVQIKFDPDLQGPLGLRGLFLHEADFEIGVAFEPPGVNFGFEGKSYISAQSTVHDPGFQFDEFALVLEVVEEVPNPQLLLFYVDEIDLKKILELFVGGNAANNFNPPAFMNEIQIRQLAFYWAESVVIMPDGTVTNPGIRFNGNLEILSFKMHADLKIDQTGISGDFEMGPLHFAKVLDITGDGKGVYINEAEGKRVQKKIDPKEEPSQNSLSRIEVVPPGGPVFQFNTTRSPYLHASLKASLFQVLHFEVEADISNQGFHFQIEVDVSDIAKAVLEVTVNQNGMTAHSAFGLHLKADLGPIKFAGVDFGTIHLDAGFDLEMTLTITKDDFGLDISGDFEFEGLHLTLPTLSLHVAPSSFKELPKLILEHIGENLEEIFKDVFEEIGHLFEEAGQEIEKIGKEVEEEVVKIAHEAEAVAKEVEQAAEEVVKDLEKDVEAVIKEAEEIEQKAVEVLEKAGEEVKKIIEKAEQEIEKIGAEIVQIAEEAAHEIEVIAQQIAHEVEEIAKAIANFAAYALDEVKKIADAIAAEVSQILEEARQVVDAILREAKKIVDAIEQEAEAIWNEIKHLAEEAKEKLEQVGRAIANAAEKVWGALKKY
ncbi:MAG: hypothetical protein SF052_12740 [Bacteroidia bacterium]|nr:hypothetical protein [Bacteroidia bacterium]